MIGAIAAPPALAVDRGSETGLTVETGRTVVAVVAHARAVPSLRREAFAAELTALPPHEGLIVVRTCHRVEAYVSPSVYGDRPLPAPPAGTVRLQDVDAARHLIAVACGLDSAILGEDQILHQLREILAARHAERPLDPILERLFESALRAGRQARAWFSGPPRSLADIALDRIARGPGPLDGTAILVVGAGHMGRLAAHAARRRGARGVVTSRTDAHAAGLASQVGGTPVPFGELEPADSAAPAGVIVALSGPWAIGPGERDRLARWSATVVDLSSPPSVPDALQVALADRFVSVDALAAAPEAAPSDRFRARLEGLVSRTGREYCSWLRARGAVPAIQAMTKAAEAQRRSELDWLFRRLPPLSDEERLLIEQMSHRLVGGILHVPLARLGADPDAGLEQAARQLFGL